MKKDSAAKARLDLLGKPLGENVLFAQWMDANQITAELIHSKCLCVENLPIDYTGDDLLQNFSTNYKPVFYQLAQDEDSSVGGFAVIEYETAEQTEEVQESTDGLTINEKRVHVSYCAPGAPGRSTLATLIAAQRMMKNNQKGLLPEPNAVQIMNSLNTPGMLQMLLRHQMHGCANKFVLGSPMNVPHLVNPSVSPAFLHLNKIHQSCSKNQTSLLGEPPKEIHLSTNPYLNLASVLPSVCLSGAVPNKANNTKSQSVAASNSINSVNAQGNTAQHAVENSFNYARQYNDYTQDSVQQWYQQYAQAYHSIQTKVGDLENNGSDESNGGVYGDYGTYLQVMPSYYAAAQGFFHPSVLPFTPQNPLKMTPMKNEKRSSSYLITNPEDNPVEYVGPHTQGSGMHYTELYLKRKRVY
ncbi:PREDICTED: ribonucleoprotein PTB-binding 2-like [Thamnophis sirtalis]|uniref:Ribonucleoprotein PTB-binding 2-like n=1 Tax=Thamnophis sirtalis TaxID=35019 RepID=A0A6I9YJI5_9SAUR|nr:PREDICTED: ribonucleoprotein PTB-binding 2-like [Thamnophis sirtalis]